MTNLEIALSYLDKGLSLIPLYSPEMLKIKPSKGFREELDKKIRENDASDNPTLKDDVTREVLTRWCKKPCISGWKEYQHKLPAREEVTNWFTMNPTANIGIITGAISNLVVFDLDSESAVQYADEQGGFPDTVKVKTGKGYHIYMKHPGFVVKNQVNKKLDIDIRADGGYVVTPPSRHGSGHYYQWEEGYSISQIDPAPCITWMIDYLRDISKIDPDTENKLNDLAEEFSIIELDDKLIQAAAETKPQESIAQAPTQDVYVGLLQNGCRQGERNHSATKLIGYLLKTGMKDTEVWEMVQMWNRDKVHPPLDQDELQKTFDSVRALEKKNQTAKPTPPKIQIESFLDDMTRTVKEYQQDYVRVPFANSSLTELENLMNGGFVGGGFYLFGGIPSSGKTVLLNNIADNICLNGYPVLFFSYDDGRSELRYRTFSRFAGQSIENFNLRTLKDIGSIFQIPQVKEIITRKYVVQQMIPVEKWNELIDPIRVKHGKAPVIIIDYLRKLRTEKGNGEERLRVDGILSKLTEIAKIYNTPVIAISELARDSYKAGQRLSMASFKESGTIEYEASWLGILGAVEEDGGEYKLKENWDTIIQQDGNVDLIIFKAKRGTGATGRVPLKVDKNFMTVTERPVKPTHDPTAVNPVKTKF